MHQQTLNAALHREPDFWATRQEPSLPTIARH